MAVQKYLKHVRVGVINRSCNQMLQAKCTPPSATAAATAPAPLELLHHPGSMYKI